MDEGISLTGLTIGGTALATIGGLVGAWIKARHARTEIRPQPLAVREDKAPPAADICDDRHHRIDEQVRDLYIRLNLAEKTIAKLEQLQDQVKSMDGKLDTILRNMRVYNK